MNKDQKLIAEAYSKVLESSMRDWDYDNELQLEPEAAQALGLDPRDTYYAQAYYDVENFHDAGDGRYTPPSSWVKTEIEPGALFFKENPETGDIDVPVTEEGEPALYKALLDALDQKVYAYEAER
jgi:hypothetical protein